ncbi:MAG: hypothetical protein ACOH5I_10450 [Oligoflexus sp.]
MAQKHQLQMCALLSLLACRAVHGQAPEITKPAAFQIQQGFATTDACQNISADSEKIFTRCELGGVELVIPQGFALQGLTLEAHFRGRLQNKGDQIAAVVRSRFGEETLSTFQYYRLPAGPQLHAEQKDLLLRFKLPTISACQADRKERFDLRSTYFVNAASGQKLPELQYLTSKVVDYQLQVATCED